VALTSRETIDGSRLIRTPISLYSKPSARDLVAVGQRQHHTHGGHPVPPNHQDQMLRPPEFAWDWLSIPRNADGMKTYVDH
jgi:hypothetical protein